MGKKRVVRKRRKDGVHQRYWVLKRSRKNSVEDDDEAIREFMKKPLDVPKMSKVQVLGKGLEDLEVGVKKGIEKFKRGFVLDVSRPKIVTIKDIEVEKDFLAEDSPSVKKNVLKTSIKRLDPIADRRIEKIKGQLQGDLVEFPEREQRVNRVVDMTVSALESSPDPEGTAIEMLRSVEDSKRRAFDRLRVPNLQQFRIMEANERTQGKDFRIKGRLSPEEKKKRLKELGED